MASTSSITTIRDAQCNQQKMQWSKLRVQSFHHGKREDVTSLGTLKIDIFEVFGYVNLGGKKSLQIWMRLEETLLNPFLKNL